MNNTTNKYLCYLSTLTHLYFSFFLHHLIIPISGAGNISSSPYSPTDNIVLDCGSSGNSTAWDDRVWIGDIGSEFAPLEQPYNVSSNLTAPNSGTVDPVPYMTARVSRSQFTYKFQVTEGQKFIRLYFYPASYQSFDRSKAFFSVKAGPYTLLSNFSASLNVDALNLESLIKEFIVNVKDNPVLYIIFAPSPSVSNDTYAFINGIEIVSMPTNLYYTPSGDVGLGLIGQHSVIEIDNNTALETAYRLNVGGSSISATKDSGMFRSWSDDDSYYLLTRRAVNVNTTMAIKYTKIPAYTAPEEVYRTARSMGNNKTENMGYNLTWRLPVDSGFIYLVRLHFCEYFQLQIGNTRGIRRERTFRIFIKNQTAEDDPNVISWSGGIGVPVYSDYVVTMEEDGVKGKHDLFIALRPSYAYSDAILNGLEVFKLSNYDYNLAGPNPEPQVEPLGPPTKKSKTNKRTSLIAVGGSLMGGLLVISLLCYTAFLQRRRMNDYGSYYCGPYSWWCWLNPFKTKSSGTKGSLLPEDLCRHFSLAEIRTATNNFNDEFIIGVGGFGNVYKGYIDGGDTVVAIKRLNPESRQGAHEFKTEIEMLSQLRHIHLVSLIGYSNDKQEMILVYDYMINGNLRDHLYGTNKDPLPWKNRLEICIGAARGLHYLHTGAKYRIIHRDVKPTNILLDEKWVAKVSDFGLSKMGPSPTNMPNAAVSTYIKGTWGYLDPEYIRRQQLTEKSDVYSFGVVLFQVLCARKAVDHKVNEDQVNLADWAQECIREGILDQIIDPYLMGKITPLCLRKFVEVAESCLLGQGINRPTMGDVMGSLELALQLQDTAEATKEDIMLGDGDHEENSEVSTMGTSNTELTCRSLDAVDITSEEVFSDIHELRKAINSGKILERDFNSY